MFYKTFTQFLLNIVKNGSLWSNVVFKKDVFFQKFEFETSDLEYEVSKSSIWKHTTSCDKGVFLSLLSRNFNDQLSQIFTGLLFYAHAEIHHVRRLVFDNYQ